MTSLVSRILKGIGKRSSVVLALSLPVCAYLPKEVSDTLIPYISLIIVGLISVAMIRVDIGRVVLHLKQPFTLVFCLVLLMLIIPVGIYWLVHYLDLPLPLQIALVLMACAAPLGSAPNLAFMLKLDGEWVFNVTLAGTLLIPMTAPWIIDMTLGGELIFDRWALFSKLLLTVGGSIFIAVISRKLLGNKRIQESSAELDGLSTLIMVLFVMTAMAGVSQIIETDPFQVIVLLLVAICANFGAQLLFSGLGMILVRLYPSLSLKTLLSFAMVAGNRNLGLVAAAIPLVYLEQILPFLALYQVPIYLTPLVGGGFYGAILKARSHKVSVT